MSELTVTDSSGVQVIVQTGILVTQEDCSIDSDGDGVNDCIDICPLAAGDEINQ